MRRTNLSSDAVNYMRSNPRNGKLTTYTNFFIVIVNFMFSWWTGNRIVMWGTPALILALRGIFLTRLLGS
jgi:hypothetical protein